MKRSQAARIALGTAQFGLDYGINNSSGKIAGDEAARILNLASSRGIEILDTAPAYGDSEVVLGRMGSGSRFRVVSKLPPSHAESVRESCEESLLRLRADSLYGFLLHDFKSFRERQYLWIQMRELRSEGLAQRIGFSLYNPQDLDFLLEKGVDFDLLQVPGNVLDRRFLDRLAELSARHVEVHVRSVFLQGLLFQDSSTLSPYFGSLGPKFDRLRSIAQSTELPVGALCLNFVLAQPGVDDAVVGVDSVENLEEILSWTSEAFSQRTQTVLRELETLREDDENLILPTRWPART